MSNLVGSLVKTPLTALVFAALMHFIAALIPYSQGYSEVLAAFEMPFTGYIFMIAYGLWLSIILTLLITNVHAGGIKLVLLLAAPFFGSQWFVPVMHNLYFGETTGAMARSDLWLEMARGCVSGLLLLLLAFLLFKLHEPETQPKNAPQKPLVKYKIKKLDLAIKLIVLPVIYIVIYFLAWYFLLWRVEAVRVYYTGDATHRGFIEEIINMLLTNASQVPMALVKGLAYALILLPLLKPLAGKRIMFIIITVMLYAGYAVQMLIPSPVMPYEVRMAHLVELAVDSVVFGGLAAFMLNMSMLKEEVKPPAPPANPNAKAKQAPAAKPAAK